MLLDYKIKKQLDLLIAGADVNHAPAGSEPPLCVAVTAWEVSLKHFSLTRLTQRYETTHRLPADEEGNLMGPTLTELASNDRVLHGLLMAYQTPYTTHRVIEEVD